jgi:hypothetical protein
MSRQDQYEITVAIDGNKIAEPFDKMSGGAIDSSEVKYKPGGMVPQISLGGSVEVTNITVERLFDLDRDSPIVADLKGKVGKSQVTISRQSLDVNGHPHGALIVWTGKLKMLTFPDADSESNAAALFQLEVSVSGDVHVT